MSLFRRALRSVGLRVGKDRYLAGTDLEGNSFYERPHPEFPGEWRKNKRTVEYKVTRYLSDYNFHTIPVQWSSWLRRTRRNPPSITELEHDYLRQIRLRENVDKLELAYRDEKLRLGETNRDALLSPPTTTTTTATTTTTTTSRPPRPRPETNVEQQDDAGAAAAVAGGGRPTTFDEGLPKDDTGIGAREAEVGKHLGGANSASPTTTTTTTTRDVDPTLSTPPRSIPSTTTMTTEGEEQDRARLRRELDREAARKRREEFARNAPPSGNPSDSFQPQAWSPPIASKR